MGIVTIGRQGWVQLIQNVKQVAMGMQAKRPGTVARGHVQSRAPGKRSLDNSKDIKAIGAEIGAESKGIFRVENDGVRVSRSLPLRAKTGPDFLSDTVYGRDTARGLQGQDVVCAAPVRGDEKVASVGGDRHLVWIGRGK